MAYPPEPLKATSKEPAQKWSEVESVAHEHTDSRGYVHKCYHKCRHTVPWAWVIGVWIFQQTIGFPLEHGLWEKVWPFKLLTAWWGL